MDLKDGYLDKRINFSFTNKQLENLKKIPFQDLGVTILILIFFVYRVFL